VVADLLNLKKQMGTKKNSHASLDFALTNSRT
jgi:hypothetical protein